MSLQFGYISVSIATKPFYMCFFRFRANKIIYQSSTSIYCNLIVQISAIFKCYLTYNYFHPILFAIRNSFLVAHHFQMQPLQCSPLNFISFFGSVFLILLFFFCKFRYLFIRPGIFAVSTNTQGHYAPFALILLYPQMA